MSPDRERYREGLPDHHDPTAGIGGASPARSALTLRAVLAGFGLVVSAVGAVLAWGAGIRWFAVVLVVVAVIALADLCWILYRKWRGEPG
ncbi:hypothetical protein H7X46_09015 [Pseudonocardia sp. C8]|uniref:DUF6343 family protein n=1 Tax=Pseudonocardia sp. C8 TaxID=2762759 RepID=UPI0016432E79|nr:hypothetical protein [Pseudonocardia sp. C8]MBC3191199.1 hypothetical protein [Pseudonocardia sp. C8]